MDIFQRVACFGGGVFLLGNGICILFSKEYRYNQGMVELCNTASGVINSGLGVYMIGSTFG